jgi:UDP-N-acetylmuramate dehydrogenase
LKRLKALCRDAACPLLIMGSGTNMVVRDGGWNGVVAVLRGGMFDAVEYEGKRVTAGAGVKLNRLVIEAARRSLSGLEPLAGIPGTVGGAVRMNAGARGRSFGDLVEETSVMLSDGSVRRLKKDELKFGYRSCNGLGDKTVLSAALALAPGLRSSIESAIRRNAARHAAHFPVKGSAGCIFKNPEKGLSAGAIIDSLGLKGLRVGRAFVSEAHANVILTEDGAAAAEVIELIDTIRKRVLAEKGVTLEREVTVVGVDRKTDK